MESVDRLGLALAIITGLFMPLEAFVPGFNAQAKEDMRAKFEALPPCDPNQSNAKPLYRAQSSRRTWGTHRYSDDPNADFSYQIGGVLRVSSEYDLGPCLLDPPFFETEWLFNPLRDRRYDDYDIIVVVNRNGRGKPDDGVDRFVRGQTVRVYDRSHSEDAPRYYWLASSARRGKSTPAGYFNVQSFSSKHQSNRYNDAHMHWAVFFNGHIALHAIDHWRKIDRLGSRDSQGCVRLEPNRAIELFHMIGQSEIRHVPIIDRNGNPTQRTRETHATLIIVK